MNEYLEKHQKIQNEAHRLQEDSEKYWATLINQARTETRQQQKCFNHTLVKFNKLIHQLHMLLSDAQQKHITDQSTLEKKNSRITVLSNQYYQLQEKHQKTTATTAFLQEQVHHLKQSLLKNKTA